MFLHMKLFLIPAALGLLLSLGFLSPSVCGATAVLDHVASLPAAAPPSFYATILDLDQRESDPVVGFWEGPGKPWIAGGAKRGPAATGLPPTQSLRPAAHSNPFVEQAQPGQPPRLPEFIKNENLVLVLGDRAGSHYDMWRHLFDSTPRGTPEVGMMAGLATAAKWLVRAPVAGLDAGLQMLLPLPGDNAARGAPGRALDASTRPEVLALQLLLFTFSQEGTLVPVLSPRCLGELVVNGRVRRVSDVAFGLKPDLLSLLLSSDPSTGLRFDISAIRETAKLDAFARRTERRMKAHKEAGDLLQTYLYDGRDGLVPGAAVNYVRAYVPAVGWIRATKMRGFDSGSGGDRVVLAEEEKEEPRETKIIVPARDVQLLTAGLTTAAAGSFGAGIGLFVGRMGRAFPVLSESVSSVSPCAVQICHK